jgi:hydroxyacid-oxoacid transhydrogenase
VSGPPAARHVSPNATTLRWAPAPLLYGLGATAEIGGELQAMGMKRLAIITDANVAATGLADEVAAYARQVGVDCVVWAGAEMEPTERSALRAVDELSAEKLDAYIGLGGGSALDTCKVVNLLSHYPAELVSYVARPLGEGRKVPGRLSPMIGVPTTAGPGAESTAAAALEISALGEKASIVDPALRPAMAVIDPFNTITAPPAATASAGYDALVQAIESYTSRPFDQVPATTARERPAMMGANPISDVWCERAIALCGSYLARSVHNGYDVEARVGMAQAAMFARLGTAGAHVPHATGAAIASLAHDYVPTGFVGLDRPVVPHGHSVVGAAAESLAFTYAGAPERHRHAAMLLGVGAVELNDAPQQALPRWIRRLVDVTSGPTHLGAFGFTSRDVPRLVDKAIAQTRLLPRSPRPVSREAMTEIFVRSLGQGGT